MIRQDGVPYVGQIFKTSDEAKEFYKQYGREEGFSTVIISSQKKKKSSDGLTCYVFGCERYGHPKKQANNKEANSGKEAKEKEVNSEKHATKRNTNTVKCDCKAKLRLIKNDDGRWIVTKFINLHNHGMVSPSKRPRMSVNRNMPKAARVLVETFREENLPVGKVVSILDGNAVGFDERDCYNHLCSMRDYKTPTSSDATLMLDFFKKKSIEDPQFFYAIQPDSEGRAVNFFWADGRSRSQYELFGDVLYFDTTYKKNVYGMPFAPFTGVNHHLQSIQFGCALLLDETEESFVWAFETWLGAMGGRHPISIITDQDRAMGLAIARVFPSSRHRYCLWHILKKFPMYLSHVYFKKSKFKKEIKWCIRGTYRISDFETMWNELMVKYDLVGHEWLKELYGIRERWAPVYHLGTFYAAMSTTGRSEGMNSFYQEFLNHHTTLIQFVTQNEKCLQRIVQREKDEDHTSEHKDRLVKENSFLLNHASRLYTRNVYVKFKEQWDKATSNFKLQGTKNIEEITVYTYISRKEDDNRQWNVEFNCNTLEGKCECQYFDFMGIPCGHLIKVFQREDIDEIPDFFIKKRWMQGANRYRAKYDGRVVRGTKTSNIERIAHLTKVATHLVYDAAEEVNTYTWMVEELDELSRKYKEHKENIKASTTCSQPTLPCSPNPNDPSQMPNVTPQSLFCSEILNVDTQVSINLSQVSMQDSQVVINISTIPSDPIQIPTNSQAPLDIIPCDPTQIPTNSQAPLGTPIMLLNPRMAKPKGRPKTKGDHSSSGGRIKSSLEKNNKKRKRKENDEDDDEEDEKEGRLCYGCDKRGTGHDIRNCPNPKKKVDKKGATKVISNTAPTRTTRATTKAGVAMK